mmetsp:Transcript_18885/g.40641  ORF Transcript_18885/g.40641 Transcript_18885/m.40641 type:complete len:256 (+) Transcript_18885:143-910(+)
MLLLRMSRSPPPAEVATATSPATTTTTKSYVNEFVLPRHNRIIPFMLWHNQLQWETKKQKNPPSATTRTTRMTRLHPLVFARCIDLRLAAPVIPTMMMTKKKKKPQESAAKAEREEEDNEGTNRYHRIIPRTIPAPIRRVIMMMMFLPLVHHHPAAGMIMVRSKTKALASSLPPTTTLPPPLARVPVLRLSIHHHESPREKQPFGSDRSRPATCLMTRNISSSRICTAKVIIATTIPLEICIKTTISATTIAVMT